MAIGTTFPTRGALRRPGVRPLDILVAAAALLVLVAAVRVGQGAVVSLVPSRLAGLDTSPSNIPYYAGRSLLRMFVALGLSFVFSLGYAYAAARSRRARAVLLPALDILQSVPVLGFLTVVVPFFLAVFRGSLLGLEAASVFAVFTAQAWNITFAFYQSLITLPRDLDEASRVMGLSRWRRFWSMEVPSGAIGLVWNGMMSFGGSWFFLTASEQISLGGSNLVLPGIGSYVGVASARGELGRVAIAIVTMVVMVIVTNFLFWRPLTAYSERFRVEDSEATQKQRSYVLDILRRTRWSSLGAGALRKVGGPVGRAMGWITGVDDQGLEVREKRRRLADIVFAVVVIGALGYGLASVGSYLASGPNGFGIFKATFALGLLTFLRVLIVLAISTAIWVPIGVWIGFNPGVTRFAQPVVQILASFPANFLFPFLTLTLVALGIGLDWGGILLMALGTQWYILFNVIAGASAVPSDMREAMANLGVGGRAVWRRMILPAIFAAYVTGAITAAGGAWNASIVAEVVSYNGHTLVAHGLGAFITQATQDGDYHRIVAGLLTMSVFVVGLNGLLWRRLYRLAETRYSLT